MQSGGCTRGSGEFLVLHLLVVRWVHSFVVVGVLMNVGDGELGYMWLRVWGKRGSFACSYG